MFYLGLFFVKKGASVLCYSWSTVDREIFCIVFQIWLARIYVYKIVTKQRTQWRVYFLPGWKTNKDWCSLWL